MSWGIFIHPPDGDMGDGIILAGFRTAEAADRKAALIREDAEKRGRTIECVIVPQRRVAVPARLIVDRVDPE